MFNIKPLIKLIITEFKKDLILIINYYYYLYNKVINYSLIKKCWYLFLMLSAILPIFLLIYIMYFFIQYFFKYFFILMDYIFDYYFNNEIKDKFINLSFISYYYFGFYLILKFLIILFFKYLPVYLKMFKNLIKNYFYINSWLKNYIKKFRTKIDNITYDIYLYFEYIFGFSYILKWKLTINNKYIPRYKKYINQYWLIFLDNTIKLRKQLYLYFLYQKFIRYNIFWLYIKEIYLDLILTSLKATLYYIFILAPLYLYIIIKYNIIFLYTKLLFNKREWIKPLILVYFNYALYLIFLYFCYFLTFLLIFIIILFYIILKFIFEYSLASIVLDIKVKLNNWYFYYNILYYEDFKLRWELVFQIYTLFLFVYMHAFSNLINNLFFWYIIYYGNYKFYYFNKFYYKLYIYLFIIHFIY